MTNVTAKAEDHKYGERRAAKRVFEMLAIAHLPPAHKYQWLEIDPYKDWQTLATSLEKILREFGNT